MPTAHDLDLARQVVAWIVTRGTVDEADGWSAIAHELGINRAHLWRLRKGTKGIRVTTAARLLRLLASAYGYPRALIITADGGTGIRSFVVPESDRIPTLELPCKNSATSSVIAPA